MLTGTRQDALGGELVRALEACWAEIRAQHPEVPPAVLVTGAGSVGSRALRLGHFAASRWHTASDGALCEVFIGGEGFARGARPVLATLFHEAAHAIAHARQIKDVSRQGRYHNRRFKTLAEELGLLVEHHPSLGWSGTTLPERTASRFANALEVLERALNAHRAGEPSPGSRPRNAAACVFACGRRIRIAPSVLAQGPVICGVCSQPFKPQETAG